MIHLTCAVRAASASRHPAPGPSGMLFLQGVPVLPDTLTEGPATCMTDLQLFHLGIIIIHRYRNGLVG